MGGLNGPTHGPYQQTDRPRPTLMKQPGRGPLRRREGLRTGAACSGRRHNHLAPGTGLRHWQRREGLPLPLVPATPWPRDHLAQAPPGSLHEPHLETHTPHTVLRNARPARRDDVAAVGFALSAQRPCVRHGHPAAAGRLEGRRTPAPAAPLDEGFCLMWDLARGDLTPHRSAGRGAWHYEASTRNPSWRNSASLPHLDLHTDSGAFSATELDRPQSTQTRFKKHITIAINPHFNLLPASFALSYDLHSLL